MEIFDLVLTGGRVLLPDGSLVEADLAISNGRFAAIAAPRSLSGAGETVELGGLVLMPGAVDAHIHLGHGNDITRPRAARDAETETAAAAAGGVTTLLSYLISTEPYEAGILDEVCAIAAAGARIDFGYHLVISTDAQLAGVSRYVRDYGIPTMKFFMYNRGGEGARLGLPDADDGFLFRLAEAVADANGILCPHCENIEVAWVMRDRVKASDPEGRGGLRTWNASRPPFVEAEAVHRVATLARQAGAAVHMVHCTSAAALQAALAQRRLGTRLSIETCTQYLTHTVDWEGGQIGKVNPPLREAGDVEALWSALESGDIDTVATDHVHRPVSAKSGDIWTAAPGFPGLETLLPVLVSEGYHKRQIPLATIARVLSTNPARIMGCRSKGTIAIGMDADLAIIDLDATWTADGKATHSDAGFSIYDGWKFTGRVVHTLVRGRFVYREGMLCDEAIGTGRFLRRHLGAARVGASRELTAA